MINMLNDLQIKHIDIGNGDEAVFNTVRIMSEVINESSANYKVRKFAESILEDKYTGTFNESNIVNIIYNYLLKNTKYLYDINGVELIKSPLLIIDEIEAGHTPLLDCDDYTVFSLSLLKSIGFNVAIRIIATNGTKEYDHVYGLVKIKGEWLPIDCTLQKGIGIEYQSPKRIADYEVLILNSNKLFKGLSELITYNENLIPEKTYTFKTIYKGTFEPSESSINLQDLAIYIGGSNVRSITIANRAWFSSDWYFYITPKQSKPASFFVSRLIEGLANQNYKFDSNVIIDGEKQIPPTVIAKAVSSVTKTILEPIALSVSKPLYPLAIIAGSIAAIYVFMNIRAFSLPSSK